MTTRVFAASLAALAGLAVAAPTASATDYFATTGITATTQNCRTPETACTLGRAMQQIPGIAPDTQPVGVHTLTLAPGLYDVANFDAGGPPFNDGRLIVDRGLTVQGTPGQPIPTIDVTGVSSLDAGVRFSGGGILRDVLIQGSSGSRLLEAQGTPPQPGDSGNTMTIDRVTVRALAPAANAAVLSGRVVARNSRFEHRDSADGTALSLSTFGADVPRIVNSNLRAPEGVALGVTGGGQGAGVSHRFELVNDAIRGRVDIDASSAAGGGGGTAGLVVLDLKNSAWRPAAPNTTTTGPVTVNQVTPALTADPLLDENNVPASGSPLVDAGTTDPDTGTVDLFGKPRSAGAAIDIGAIEFQPPATTGGGTTGGGTTGGGTTGGGGGSAATETPNLPKGQAPERDTTAPTAVSLNPPKTLKRSKLSKGKGVTLTATLDEALASAKVELIQVTKKKGKAPKEKVLGSATLGASGTSLSFPLKVKATKLGKGKLKLTLRFTFVDAAGNKTVVDKAVTVS